MRIAIMGSGAVGGYYGARLALAGHDVTFIARGAHLEAIRARGLHVKSPALGDFTARARADDDPARVGPVDVVLFAVKVARAEGVPVSADVIQRIETYVSAIPGTMRSSLLIDLSQGKRIEVEALHGALVRRAARVGVDVPIMATLYAVLKPWATPPA